MKNNLLLTEGGSADPTSNVRLAHVVERARRHNMPVASIQSALKRGSASKNEENSKRFMLELRGPVGSVLLCEVLTDNITRTKLQISTIIKKHSIQLSGIATAALHLFDYKGFVETTAPKEFSEDTVTAHAIDCGAEDVSFIENNFCNFTCEPKQLKDLQVMLEKLGYVIKDAELLYVPKTRVQVPESYIEELSVIVEKLENLEDVVGVYDNIG